MKYVVNAGQDCSTILLMEYSGLPQRHFFFDKLVIYSDDWVKAFTNSFINSKEDI